MSKWDCASDHWTATAWQFGNQVHRIPIPIWKEDHHGNLDAKL